MRDPAVRIQSELTTSMTLIAGTRGVQIGVRLSCHRPGELPAGIAVALPVAGALTWSSAPLSSAALAAKLAGCTSG